MLNLILEVLEVRRCIGCESPTTVNNQIIKLQVRVLVTSDILDFNTNGNSKLKALYWKQEKHRMKRQ